VAGSNKKLKWQSGKTSHVLENRKTCSLLQEKSINQAYKGYAASAEQLVKADKFN